MKFPLAPLISPVAITSPDVIRLPPVILPGTIRSLVIFSEVAVIAPATVRSLVTFRLPVTSISPVNPTPPNKLAYPVTSNLPCNSILVSRLLCLSTVITPP